VSDDAPLRSVWDTSKEDPDKWAQKRRLADAMRLVIERLTESDAPEEELRRAADALEIYADALAAHPRLRYVHGFAESANAGDVAAFFDRSPLIGLANPLAPPITIGKTGERTAEGRVVFGTAYEGPPGNVHGGFVAAAFDEVLGFVQSLSGRPGMTGTLIVRYRKPTPLHTPLRFEAEYLRHEGRKLFTESRVYAGDLLCAEAEGVFVSIERERFMELEELRAAREAERNAGDSGKS
jgi:acyl-coenzyme A thioesterase PaaI-like protein